MITTILRILTLVGILLTLVLLVIYYSKHKSDEAMKEELAFGKKHAIYNSITALIANFLDVEGVGTHAVNSVAFKMGKSVQDSNIPGTLNVGATVPCCLAAFLFLPLSNMDELTLVSMIIAAIVGSFLGSKVVNKINTLGVRLLMGVGLIFLSAFMIVRCFGIDELAFPGAGLKLTGIRLVIGILCSFVFGLLMNMGVGFYAPCLAVCSLLGLNLAASMSIMFGACSLLMAYGNTPQYIKSGKFDFIASITQIVFGSIGVVIAYFFVKSLPITVVNIIVAIAVIVTGILFIKDYIDAMKKHKSA